MRRRELHISPVRTPATERETIEKLQSLAMLQLVWHFECFNALSLPFIVWRVSISSCGMMMCLNTAGARHIRFCAWNWNNRKIQCIKIPWEGLDFNRWIAYSKIIPVYYEGQIPLDNQHIKTGVNDYNYQNPSLFLFINLLIRAIAILPHWSFKI